LAGGAALYREVIAHAMFRLRGVPRPVGRGNLAAGYPVLQAQQSVYVAKQLNDYATGALHRPTPLKQAATA